jgi:hypothetical protein
MSATKEELEEMGKDLFKRLGGMRTKDGRIVRGLLALWKAAESNLAVIEAEQKMHPTEEESAKKSDSLVIGG